MARSDGGVPFSWTGVSLYAIGATNVRVRLTRAADGALAVAIADAEGAPVASVEALATRPISGRLNTAGAGSLFHVDWVPVPVEAASEDVAVVGPGGLAALTGAPGTVLVEVSGSGPVVESVHAETSRVLGLLREWPDEDRFAGSHLVFVTRPGDLAGAAVRAWCVPPSWRIPAGSAWWRRTPAYRRRARTSRS